MARGVCKHPMSTRVRRFVEVPARSRIVSALGKESGLVAKRVEVSASFEAPLHCGACGRLVIEERMEAA